MSDLLSILLIVAIVTFFALAAAAIVSGLEHRRKEDRTDFLIDVLLFGGLGTAFGWLFRKLMNLPKDE